MGFDIDREDLISVSCMPFAQDDTDVSAMSTLEKNRELIMTLVKYALAFLAILLVLFLVIRPLLKWLTTRSGRVVDRVHAHERGIPAEDRELLEGGEELPQIEAVAKSDEMKQAVQGKRKTIEHITKNDMNTATAVVKSWLQENV